MKECIFHEFLDEEDDKEKACRLKIQVDLLSVKKWTVLNMILFHNKYSWFSQFLEPFDECRHGTDGFEDQPFLECHDCSVEDDFVSLMSYYVFDEHAALLEANEFPLFSSSLVCLKLKEEIHHHESYTFLGSWTRFTFGHFHEGCLSSHVRYTLS